MGATGPWRPARTVRSATAWTFLDAGTGVINPLGATLAGTWPFLSCVVSCSGAVLQVDCHGMTDAAPDLLTSNPVSVGASWTATLTTGITRTTASNWTLFFGSAGISKPTSFLITQIPSPGNNFGTSKAGRRLLCDIDGTNPAGFCTAKAIGMNAGSQSSCSGAIPKKVGLICNAWCAQAVVVGAVPAGPLGGGNRRLSSAINGIVGTNP